MQKAGFLTTRLINIVVVATPRKFDRRIVEITEFTYKGMMAMVLVLCPPRSYIEGAAIVSLTVGESGWGEIFYCTMEVTSLKKEVSPPGSIILLGHQRNLHNKSTVIESVERVCVVCVGELLAAFLNFPEVHHLTETNGNYEEFGFPRCVREGRVIDGTNVS